MSPTFTEILVVGMHFRERDGVPAKSIVQNFIPPVELQLEREPENPFDSYAIKVLFEGQHIGYIEADSAAFIAPYMDEGTEFRCVVDNLIERKRNLHPQVTISPVS